MSKQVLWVVELRCGNGWEPTVGASLTREAARRDLAQWRVDNPIDDFRLRVYVPQGVQFRKSGAK